jgi:hypothetical protein
LIALGGFLIVVIIALIGGGLLLYWLSSNPVVLGFVASVAIGVVLYALWQQHAAIDAPVKDLKDRIRWRKSLGYETTDLEQVLIKANANAAEEKKARSARKSKPKSRRELGYTDDQDNV